MMKFNSDHYFQIGSLHYQQGKPCQDYALSGFNERAAMAIVSDGCSTGRHTDLGARVQALSLLGAMRAAGSLAINSLYEITETVSKEKERLSKEAKNLLGLSRSDMLATSLFAYASPLGAVVQIEGDGVVVKRFKDGRLVASRYEWLDNRPFYPTYDEEDRKLFVISHGGDQDEHRLSRTTLSFNGNGELEAKEVSWFTLSQGMDGVTETIQSHEIKDLGFLAVFTDGVAQIEEVEWQEAVKTFMAYKSLEGEFVKRRMIRGLKNYMSDGKSPVDDISIAVIRIESLEEEGGENVTCGV